MGGEALSSSKTAIPCSTGSGMDMRKRQTMESKSPDHLQEIQLAGALHLGAVIIGQQGLRGQGTQGSW